MGFADVSVDCVGTVERIHSPRQKDLLHFERFNRSHDVSKDNTILWVHIIEHDHSNEADAFADIHINSQTSEPVLARMSSGHYLGSLLAQSHSVLRC